ncbi:hypothetical protein VaNZ11_014686 [Volvox africanus]|uniref:CHRD domain-containing protein n=1 Tax=Volvox africanus TaxID=51714 RepID=A0ABQ5SJ02_9CHLO|nr:hypothetical protein VaNZ11_014686 [Volvox africanus]
MPAFRTILHAIAALVLLRLSAAAVEERRVADSPKGPAGAIIAVANLTGTPGASGRVVFNWYNNRGNVNVTLKGSLTNITMSHIRLRNMTLGNPIIAGILPRMVSWIPKMLDPPVSFTNSYTFNATFDARYLKMIRSDMTANTFLSLLGQGSLYVSVSTTGQPGGALQGPLICKGDCKSHTGY